MNGLLISVRQKVKLLGLAPKALICLFLGGISGLAMPPVDAWWIFGFTFPALLILTDGVSLRRSFLFGWLFGFGYFLAVLHWIGFAFLINAETDLWMMPFAVGGLSAVLAIYWGLGALFTRFLCARGFEVFIIAPLSFSAMEYLRGLLFTGFPWAVPGLAVDGMGGVSQLAYLIGMNGLTFVILMWAATPMCYLRGQKRSAMMVLAVLPVAWMWGEWRLSQNPTSFVDGVNLRVVQPDLSQDDKWRNGNARLIFDQLLALSAQPSSNGSAITHIIWPESAVPFLIDESPEGLSAIGRMLGEKKILLTGAVRRSAPLDAADYFTSVLVIDGKAQVLDHYDKAHLVPGGEYLPLAWVLEPLGFRRVVDLPGSFRAGLGVGSLLVPGAGLVGAQICYEAIFPQEAVDQRNRPNWIVNVTNDGWFGNSSGPHQHLAQLRLRAIEQGLSVVRSANTGISAVIDPFGRYIFKSQIGVVGVFDSLLPQSISAGPYARYGDFGMLALWLIAILAALFVRKSHNLVS